MTEDNGPVEFREIHIKLSISAPRAAVWDALVRDLPEWWKAPYLVSETAKGMVLEPRIGGLLWEDWGSGEGVSFGQVTTLKKGERLEVTGCMALAGAVLCVVNITLADADGGTLLSLSHRATGEVTKADRDDFVGGWTELIGVRLKAFAEGRDVG